MAAPLKLDWARIRQEREERNTPYSELARKWGGSAAAIEKRAQREKWTTNAKAHAIALQRIVPTEKEAALARQRVANRAANEISELVSEAVRQARGIMEKGVFLCETADSGREYRDAAAGWAMAHNGMRAALGLDSPIAQSDQSWGGRKGVNLTIDLSSEDVIVDDSAQSSVRSHDSESCSTAADGPIPPPT